MNAADVQRFLDFSRRKTLELLDTIAKRPDAAAVLGWRPGLGRTPIGWQLMHIAATDDRHLNVRMHPGQPREPEYVRRFAGGSTPDDEVLPPETIRAYLTERRADLLAHLRSLSAEQLEQKPTPDAPWAYAEWFQVLTWHEAHHQGQAHLTLNLYKAAHNTGA